MPELSMDEKLAAARAKLASEPIVEDDANDDNDSLVDSDTNPDSDVDSDDNPELDELSDEERDALDEGGKSALIKERKLRKEAEKRAKEAVASAKAELEEFKKQIQEMLGVKIDDNPEKDYASIAEENERKAKAAERKNLLLLNPNGGDINRMMNHVGLQNDLAKVDPYADDAEEQVKSIVKKWLAKESYLKKVPSTGVDVKGGQESTSGPKTLEQKLAEARRRAGLKS